MATVAGGTIFRSSVRTAVVVVLDAGAAALSLVAALYARVGAEGAGAILGEAPYAVPLFALVACGVFYARRLHLRIWRYTSVAELAAVAEAAAFAVAAFYLLVLVGAVGRIWLPRSIPVIHLLVLVAMLGSMRIARRVLGEYLSGGFARPQPVVAPARASRPALLAGAGDEVEQLLRHLERHPEIGFRPIGVLDELGIHKRMRIRGVPVFGSLGELPQVVERLEAQGDRPQCLLLAGGADRLRGAAMVGTIAEAQRLNLDVAYPAGFTRYGGRNAADLDFRYLNVADLLGRPQARLETAAVRRAIAGRRVLVTGAGGTIGRELVRQIAAFRPAKLLLLDANELNLYEADLELGENHAQLPRAAILCSIRQRRQLMAVFAEHRPELVFHAAALKHVPLVEAHLSAGVQTNVIGTRNVADAALRYGARAMVQVSTDKAVNPVGFMGVTKRLGELYCQALDLDGVDDPDAPHFMTVRFGNVVGSSGSLIPLFQRQLSRGGPLTVTHEEIERFFMTVQEAVQLILHSAALGVGDQARRGRIFVLDMGEPVRIMDIARRMIRLAGLEPEIDVPIDIVGLRPGEKLYEELFDSCETRLNSSIAGVFEAEPRPVPLHVLAHAFATLDEASAAGDDDRCRAVALGVLAGVSDQAPASIAYLHGAPRAALSAGIG